ncbi:ATP-grasp domain-containing protein [Streptomyces sp. NPDC051639]|uniref:ATP-grasp domain-containing protein n=1 Tax=Streptomyces sp. NPDC051639 TaxID=3155671 RepID=UPI00343CF518
MRVIVTGTGGASGYAVALQAEQLGYDVLWADADPLCPALLSHPDRAQLLPLASEGDAYFKALGDAAETFNAACVSFNTDAEVRYAAGQTQALTMLGLPYWTPSEDAVRICSDKAEFAHRLGQDPRFHAPRSFTAKDLQAELPAEGVFLKRRSGSGGVDSMVCSSREELGAWLRRNPDGLVQEVLTGQEFSADCLYTGSDQPLVVARRRLRTRAGMSTVTKTFHDPLLEHLVADLLQELHVVGPSCVQGFLQPDGVVFTEVNVRFGGGCAAAYWGGTHLVEQYLALLTSEERRLPEELHDRRPFSTTTLVRHPSYLTLHDGPETNEGAGLAEPRVGER